MESIGYLVCIFFFAHVDLVELDLEGGELCGSDVVDCVHLMVSFGQILGGIPTQTLKPDQNQ